MKTIFINIRKIFYINIFILLSATGSYSQTGSSCAEPNIITSLPFTQTGLTTAGLFNYYTEVHACGSVYMTGNDYVFTYTPATDISVKVTLTNTYQYGVGVFIINACPDDSLAHCIAKAEGQNGNPVIQNVSLHADSTYYIIVSTWNYSGWIPSTNFNIDIRQIFTRDGSVGYIKTPVTSCDLSVHDTLQIIFKNYGIDTIINPKIAYRINDEPEIIETYYNIILPNDDDYFTFFYNYLDISTIGTTYKIVSYLIDTLDLNHSNDTTFAYITNTNSVSSFPYNEDFENGPGGWVTEWQDFNWHYTSWQLGTPNDTALNQAASGINAWKTNLTGTFDTLEYSFITGPCFDLTSINSPWIEFNIFYELNTLDLVTLESSTDGGYNWNTVGSPNEGTNWYNAPSGISSIGWHGYSGTWLNAKHALTGLGGQSKVQLRVLLKAGAGDVNEGVAIDDIKIYEAPMKNIGVIAITEPASGCGHTDADTIRMKIVNFGLVPQVDFNVAYRLNNGLLFSEIITDSIYPGDTLIHTFSQTADLSVPGSYNITCINQLINDQDESNDSLSITVINFQNYSTFPQAMNFETDNGGWVPTGINSSWEWGAPTDSVINYAASGTNVWKTNLDGRCNEAENSFLTGPCFDLTSLQNPYVKFNVWYENQGFGTVFEISTDDGATWLNLGNTSNNWYNQGHNWLGSSGTWVPVWHSLKNYNGVNDLQCRFNFKSLIRVHGFAFDDFTICDAPVASFSYTSTGAQISFQSTSINTTNYYWDFGDGNTDSIQNPAHIFTLDTNIVSLITSNYCSTDTITQIIIRTGINTIYLNPVKIFPNPATNEIYVNITDFTNPITIEISDIRGVTIFNETFLTLNPIKKINLSKMINGIYFMKIKSGKLSVINKLIIE